MQLREAQVRGIIRAQVFREPDVKNMRGRNRGGRGFRPHGQGPERGQGVPGVRRFQSSPLDRGQEDIGAFVPP